VAGAPSFGNGSQATKSGTEKAKVESLRAADSSLRVYGLQMSRKDLDSLERTVDSNQTYPAKFVADGKTYDVRVRYRGQWARSWPKKALKIFFDDAVPFEGQHCINLNSGWRDPAFVREHLAYIIYARAGVPAPRSRMVRIDLNGSFYGLYVEVEQPDKPLLRRSNLKGAALFKAISPSNMADERDLRTEAAFKKHYARDTQKEEGMADLQRFCHDLAQSSNVAEFLQQHVDLDEYINYLAVSILIQHWDGFNKNHFLAYDRRGSEKWLVIPWDLDRTLGDHWNGSFDFAQLPVSLGTRQFPGTTGWNRLQDRFFSEPSLRNRLFQRINELLEKEFTSEKLFPVLDQLESEISAAAALDRRRWPSGTPDLHTGIARLKSYIQRRRAYLRKELASLQQSSQPNYTLKSE
jgi:spore coat protein H